MKRRAVEVAKTGQSRLFVFADLPLIFPTLNPCNSVIVRELKELGVANISVDIADRKQLAGRLSLFKRNWEKICGDQWVLTAIQGYRIEWLTTPCQGHQPNCPHFSQEETKSLEEEIKQMCVKRAITPVETGMEKGFLSSIFLVPKDTGQLST